MEKNQKIVLASRPAAWVEESNFRFEESDIPQPGENQVLVRNHWLSLDPYMRGRMSDVKSYATPVQIGEVMVGGCAGEVVARSIRNSRPATRWSARWAGSFTASPTATRCRRSTPR
jgi:NADPH-dependent curcumin reductase CurA